MSTALRRAIDLTLAVDEDLSTGFEMSKVLLAKATFDGTLQLLGSAWERVLGYGRGELRGKALRQLMGCEPRRAAAAAAAILDTGDTSPVELTVQCRDGRVKCLRLHRRYDQREHVIHIVAELE